MPRCANSWSMRPQLDDALAAARGWPGVRRARSVLALASPLAESPLESLVRLRLHDAGFPTARAAGLHPGHAVPRRSAAGRAQADHRGRRSRQVHRRRTVGRETARDPAARPRLSGGAAAVGGRGAPVARDPPPAARSPPPSRLMWLILPAGNQPHRAGSATSCAVASPGAHRLPAALGHRDRLRARARRRPRRRHLRMRRAGQRACRQDRGRRWPRHLGHDARGDRLLRAQSARFRRGPVHAARRSPRRARPRAHPHPGPLPRLRAADRPRRGCPRLPRLPRRRGVTRSAFARRRARHIPRGGPAGGRRRPRRCPRRTGCATGWPPSPRRSKDGRPRRWPSSSGSIRRSRPGTGYRIW